MNNRELKLNNRPDQAGDCILYVMSRDQRVSDNHALIAAQDLALRKKLPLFVCFNLLAQSGYRSQEHYIFMLEGLKEIKNKLNKLNINFILTNGSTKKQIISLAKKVKPAQIIFDLSPLNGPRRLQKSIAKELKCPVSVVDTHNIIPAWILSEKQEYAAHTIRPKIHKHLARWLNKPKRVKKHPYFKHTKLGINWTEANKLVKQLPQNKSKIKLKSGEQAAKWALKKFINNLEDYAINRNNPNLQGQSNLSPYLHFGQLSSLRITLELLKLNEAKPLLLKSTDLVKIDKQPKLVNSIDSFLEELIVRKELADNYCFYNKNYKSLSGAPDWAQKTLNKHLKDQREYTYTNKQWELALTHDPAWNAAQIQMKQTGKMHGYMRMYWAKKLLEWSDSPQEAIKTAIYLNDKYSIDGGDPNGYVGILWSIAGLHDRPWAERKVFGQIRYMNYEGLKRKFNIKQYEKKWNQL